jgi:alkanesulfonate monooxygenase SsuD/methylene tetrahydromethanopterin reductase-like flavin-dependent oxidoreductase (luciferase family)
MKFGIDYFPDAHPDQVSARQYFEDVLDLAGYADELGYDSVKIVEHYFMSYGGSSPDRCCLPCRVQPANAAHADGHRRGGAGLQSREIIGDPEGVPKQLTSIRDTFGAVDSTSRSTVAMMEKEKARRSIELFARHVRPRFR